MTDLGCLGLIPIRFRLFWHDSRPMLACFGCFGQFRLPADTIRFGRYGPVQRELAQIEAESARIRKKKKIFFKTQMQHRRASSGVARASPRPCIIA